MSAAYKCDKCEQFKPGSPVFTITFQRRGSDGEWAKREVCDDCGWRLARSVTEQAKADAAEAEMAKNEARRAAEKKAAK